MSSFKKNEIYFSIITFFLFFVLIEAAAGAYEHFNPMTEVDTGGGFNVESRVFVPEQKDPNYLILNPQKQILAQQPRHRIPLQFFTSKHRGMGMNRVKYPQRVKVRFDRKHGTKSKV